MNSSFYFGMTLIGSAVVILVILSVVSMINKQLEKDDGCETPIERCEKVRKDFEAWAESEGMDITYWSPGNPEYGYRDVLTLKCWRTWLKSYAIYVGSPVWVIEFT